MNPRLTASELNAFLEEVFPQKAFQYEIESVSPMSTLVRLKVTTMHLRPGGTVSGPAMFSLADFAFYAATLAMIGSEALAVTTHCSINFMRKPNARDLLCRARILKLGKTLAVGDALIFAENVESEPVAHAHLTYAIPPSK